MPSGSSYNQNNVNVNDDNDEVKMTWEIKLSHIETKLFCQIEND